MTKAAEFRKRATAVQKKTAKRLPAAERGRLSRKASGLNALADNEDWLDGKSPARQR